MSILQPPSIGKSIDEPQPELLAVKVHFVKWTGNTKKDHGMVLT